MSDTDLSKQPIEVEATDAVGQPETRRFGPLTIQMVATLQMRAPVESELARLTMSEMDVLSWLLSPAGWSTLLEEAGRPHGGTQYKDLDRRTQAQTCDKLVSRYLGQDQKDPGGVPDDPPGQALPEQSGSDGDADGDTAST